MKSCGVCLFFSTVSSNFPSSCMQTVIQTVVHQMLLLQVFQHFSNTNLFVGDVFFKGSDWHEKKPGIVLFLIHASPCGPHTNLQTWAAARQCSCDAAGVCLFGEMSKIRLRNVPCRRLFSSETFVCFTLDFLHLCFQRGGKCLTAKNVLQSEYSQCGKDYSVSFTAAQLNVKHWILLEATRQFRNCKKL